MAQDTLLQKLANPFFLTMEATKDIPPPLEGDRWGSFSILKVEKENNRNYKMLVVAYDTGIFSLPAPVFHGSVNIKHIKVLAPSDEEIKEYAPIKELEITRENTPIWKWILFFAGLILIGWLMWYLWKKRKRENQEAVIKKEDALAMLAQVKEGWKSNGIDSQQLGDGLVNSLRMCYRVNTKRSTRQLQQAIKKDVGERLEPTLTATLDDLDAWRFGKKEATKTEGLSSIDFFEILMERLIANTKREDLT
jgi:hypothetical protein